MKIKTNELEGPALNFAVAQAEGFIKINIWEWRRIGICRKYAFEDEEQWDPSKNWTQAGPIIEREGILFLGTPGNYSAWIANETRGVCGPTHIVAAMRTYVTFKLGTEVDIPEELIK